MKPIVGLVGLEIKFRVGKEKDGNIDLKLSLIENKHYPIRLFIAH